MKTIPGTVEYPNVVKERVSVLEQSVMRLEEKIAYLEYWVNRLIGDSK